MDSQVREAAEFWSSYPESDLAGEHSGFVHCAHMAKLLAQACLAADGERQRLAKLVGLPEDANWDSICDSVEGFKFWYEDYAPKTPRGGQP